MVVAVVFLAAFVAFLISTVAGGGAGLVLVPLLRLILPISFVLTQPEYQAAMHSNHDSRQVSCDAAADQAETEAGARRPP